MEKKTVVEDVYTTIKSGTKKKSVFVASDGIHFYGKGAKQECLDYEKKLSYKVIFKNIKNKNFSALTPSSDQWYFIENIDQLKSILYVNGFLNNPYTYINGNSFVDENIILNDWYCIDCESDEYFTTVNIYSLNGIKNNVEKLLKYFSEQN